MPSYPQGRQHDIAVVQSGDRMAFTLLKCEKHLEIIRGASHLFEESGTLEQVAQLASQWFSRYLTF